MRTNVQDLNLNSTFKLLNFNEYLEHNERVLHINVPQERKQMESLLLTKEAQGYIFIVDSSYSAKKIRRALDAGAYVKYLTGSVSINLIFELGNSRNFEVLYKYHQNFTQEELINFNRARQVFRISMYMKVNPDEDITKMLFNLNDARYLIERVYFDFTTEGLDELPLNYKVDFFGRIHEILARWHIQVHLSCNSLESQEKLQDKVMELNEQNRI